MEHHIIIGSGSGIGAALARSMATPGVSLLLHAGQSADRVATVAEACRAKGAEVSTCLGLTEEEALYEAVADWLGRLPDGGLASFTFAAGYARLGSIDTTPHSELLVALTAMPVAFHRLCALVSPKLAQGRGRIVCISAFGAHRTKTHSYTPTAPAKAALEAQVRGIAANLAPRGITVNAVVPGFIEKEPGTPSSLTPEQWAKVTAGIPMNRLGAREDVAEVARFLLSEQAGYVTGQSLHVNGGLTL